MLLTNVMCVPLQPLWPDHELTGTVRYLTVCDRIAALHEEPCVGEKPGWDLEAFWVWWGQHPPVVDYPSPGDMGASSRGVCLIHINRTQCISVTEIENVMNWGLLSIYSFKLTELKLFVCFLPVLFRRPTFCDAWMEKKNKSIAFQYKQN